MTVRQSAVTALLLLAGLAFAFFGSTVVTTCLLAGFILGLLAGFAAGVGATLYFFLRSALNSI